MLRSFRNTEWPFLYVPLLKWSSLPVVVWTNQDTPRRDNRVMCLYVKYGASAVLFGCDYSSSYVEHSHILIHLIYFLMMSAKCLLTVYPSEVSTTVQYNSMFSPRFDKNKQISTSATNTSQMLFLVNTSIAIYCCIPPYTFIFILMYNNIKDIASAKACLCLQTTKTLTTWLLYVH